MHGATMANAAAPACPSTTFSNSRKKKKISCRATGDSRLPRRDVLAAGLTGLAAFPGLALADLPKVYEGCAGKGESKVTDDLLGCDVVRGLPCPPRRDVVEVVNFSDLPRPKEKRVRRAAHELGEDEVSRYRKALARMRELPASDPSSFAAQAAIHEAYCDGHYHIDPTEKNRKFDVHFSWIFAPWHRMYIYFYERMVNHYVDGDAAFALPYWSWDVPAGMAMPAMFKDSTSSLYDEYRNPEHLNAVVDLDYLSRRQLTPVTVEMEALQPDFFQDAVDRNLSTLYHQMIRTGKGAQCFLGDRFCTEANFTINEINQRSGRRLRNEAPKLQRGTTSGSLERMAHTAVHVWAGRPGPPPGKTCSDATGGALGHDGNYSCANDMGFLGSAARDPIFYSHHSNVDRLWHIWSTKLGGGNGFDDDDEWLDTSFLFYDFASDDRKDDRMRLVRVKVRDVLDTKALGYTYSEPDKTRPGYKEWKERKPSLRLPVPATAVAVAAAETETKEGGFDELDLKPGETVVVPLVARPAKTQSGKRQVQEVLVIDKIDFDPGEDTKFDVAINAPKETAQQVGPQYKEYAGSFASVKAGKEKAGDRRVAKLVLPIDDVLADIGVGAEVPLSVVIVPREGDVKIRSAPRIEIQSC